MATYIVTYNNGTQDTLEDCGAFRITGQAIEVLLSGSEDIVRIVLASSQVQVFHQKEGEVAFTVSSPQDHNFEIVLNNGKPVSLKGGLLATDGRWATLTRYHNDPKSPVYALVSLDAARIVRR